VNHRLTVVANPFTEFALVGSAAPYKVYEPLIVR